VKAENAMCHTFCDGAIPFWLGRECIDERAAQFTENALHTMISLLVAMERWQLVYVPASCPISAIYSSHRQLAWCFCVMSSVLMMMYFLFTLDEVVIAPITALFCCVMADAGGHARVKSCGTSPP
jgi:hypothetical protein